MELCGHKQAKAHAHVRPHCVIELEHTKKSNRSKKSAATKIKFDSANQFQKPPKSFELVSGRMVTSERKHTLTNTGKIGKPTCYWQEQSRHALNFQQAGFERAAQEPEQTARDEVHVAVLHKLPKCLERKCEKEWRLSKINKCKPGHQVSLLYEMNNVACDALEKQ